MRDWAKAEARTLSELPELVEKFRMNTPWGTLQRMEDSDAFFSSETVAEVLDPFAWMVESNFVGL